MKDKIGGAFWALIFGGLVTLSYAFRRQLQTAGFPLDPYFFSLLAIPIFLLLFGKISFTQMGFKIGKPLYGLFFVFLLPGILFLRFYFMGKPFVLTEGATLLVIGSIVEEFFFRGYLQSQFEKSFNNTGLSFFLTNLLFMFVHWVKGYSLLPLLMVGLVGLYFSIARDKSGGDSLVYPAGAHSLYNLVASSV